MYIYALGDEAGIRYVGKSVNPWERHRQHLSQPLRKTAHQHKEYWIKACRRRGLIPTLTILEVVPMESWQMYERWWIIFLRSLGCDLVNHTEGGEGGAIRKGQRLSPEHCAAISAARRGRTFGPRGKYKEGTGEKISLALRGRRVPREIVDKVAVKLRGKIPWNKGLKIPFSPEVRARVAAQRAAGSSWNKGLKMSREHCAKLSEVHKKRWEKRRACAQS